MSLYTIPTYCEDITHSGYANAFTNIAFIIAAFMAWRLVAVNGSRRLRVVSLLLGGIGLGSALFHTIPNDTTILFDAAPIYLFLAIALYELYVRLTQSKRVALFVVLGFITFLMCTFIFLPTNYLHGIVRHGSILSFVTVTLFYAYKSLGKAKSYLFVALGLYALAIICKSVDTLVCSGFSYGTHFLWHVSNAAAGYALVAFFVRHTETTNTPSN